MSYNNVGHLITGTTITLQHFATLHQTTLHYIYRHFTSSHLHFTTLSFGLTHLHFLMFYFYVCPHGTTWLPLNGCSWNLIRDDFAKIFRENSSFIKTW